MKNGSLYHIHLFMSSPQKIATSAIPQVESDGFVAVLIAPKTHETVLESSITFVHWIELNLDSIDEQAGSRSIIPFVLHRFVDETTWKLKKKQVERESSSLGRQMM